MKEIIDEITLHFRDVKFVVPDILIGTRDGVLLEHSLAADENVVELAAFSSAMWSFAAKTTDVEEEDFFSHPLIKADVDGYLFVVAAMCENTVLLLKFPKDTDRNRLFLESKAAIEKANKVIAFYDV